MLGGNELEVNGMNDGPDLPGSLACIEKVILELGSNGAEGISGNKSKVSEEYAHENGASCNENRIEGQRVNQR